MRGVEGERACALQVRKHIVRHHSRAGDVATRKHHSVHSAQGCRGGARCQQHAIKQHLARTHTFAARTGEHVVQAHPVTHQAGKPAFAHQKRVGALRPEAGLASQGQRNCGVNLAAVGLTRQAFERRGATCDSDGPTTQHSGDLGLRV